VVAVTAAVVAVAVAVAVVVAVVVAVTAAVVVVAVVVAPLESLPEAGAADSGDSEQPVIIIPAQASTAAHLSQRRGICLRRFGAVTGCSANDGKLGGV
jgi:hypothetical protein